MLDLKHSTVLAALAARLLLLTIGISTTLQSRIELNSPSTALSSYRDALFLTTTNSPLGSTFRGSPLLLPLLYVTNGSLAAHVVINILCDIASSFFLATAIHRVGKSTSATQSGILSFLWNPFTIATCISGSTAPIRVMWVLAAVAAACGGKATAAGIALALAVQLNTGGVGGNMNSSNDGLLATPLLLYLWQLDRKGAGREREQTEKEIRKNKSAATTTTNTNKSSGSNNKSKTKRYLTTASMFIASYILTTLLSMYISASIVGTKPSTYICSAIQQYKENIIGIGSTTVLSSSRMCSGGGSSVYVVEPWDDVQPNIGLYWYIFSEAFPRFRHVFRYIFFILPIATTLPLLVRFQRHVLCLLCIQSIVNCLMSFHPTYSDIVIWMSLLCLLPKAQVAQIRYGPATAVTLLSAILANTVTYNMWLGIYGMGNANFFYGMNLTWAGAQVLLIAQLLKAAARVELESVSESEGRAKVE